MKLFSITLVAFLCVTIVYGAPSSDNSSMDDALFSNPITDVFDKIKDFWAHVKCIQNAIDEVMDKSELKERWTTAKGQLKTIADVEWHKCLDISNKFEQKKCRIACVEKSIHVITKFLSSLFNEKQMDLVNEIRAKIAAKCFTEHADDATVENVFEDLQRTDPMTNKFQCLIDTLEKVSKDLSLDDLWNSSGLEIQANLDNWKECSNLDNRFAIIFCNVKEGARTYKLIVDYMRDAVTKNREFARYFVSDFRRNCVSYSYGIDKTIEHLKCIVVATGAAIKDTDLSIIWDEYRSDIDKAFQRIKSCQSQSNKWEIAKCVSKEIHGSFDILKNFMGHLKDANHETYVRVKTYIKQRCYQ